MGHLPSNSSSGPVCRQTTGSSGSHPSPLGTSPAALVFNRGGQHVAKSKLTLQGILEKSAKSGTAGALAMGTNVVSLMWLRTVLKYQYKNGGNYMNAFRNLYADGGLRRFYRGLPFALIQAPLCRFGDTAANTGTLEFLNNHPTTASWNIGAKTCVATAFASAFRVCLMPVDTSMITMQVHGSIRPLAKKVQTNGVGVLFHGSAAAASASVVGHFPWFFTYNFLKHNLPVANTTLGDLGRQASIGFASSVVSDTVANIFWVVKVNRQASNKVCSYPEVIRAVVRESGVSGLFFRGLETRIFSNGLQGLMFSVLWKYFEGKAGMRN